MLVVTADPNARQLTRLLLSRAMGLAELTDAEAVRAALAEFDRLGRDRFLRRYGFGRARSYFVVEDGEAYDSKAIAGVAHGFQHPDAGTLDPGDFWEGEETVARRLRELGFTVKRRASRNPDWSRDELILALDLYMTHGLVGDSDPRVIDLSQLLNQLPIHPVEARTFTFRNPNRVARKLSNLANFDPAYEGKPTRGSHLDAEAWKEWAHRPAELAAAAGAIRSAAASGEIPTAPEPDEDDPDVQAAEGRLLYRRHRVRERNPKLRDRKVEQVLTQAGRLACEVCGFDFAAAYGPRGDRFIECHHIKPLHEAGERTTKLADLALVCSNCHRMIHRRSPWPTPADLRSLVIEYRARADLARTRSAPADTPVRARWRPRSIRARRGS
jgi:5-methylcytosine-specific restriction protein A